MAESRQRLASVSLKLLRRIERGLDFEESIELKDCKAISSALKELKDIQGGGSITPPRLEIRFSDETGKCGV